jgi:hypothetical protein
MDRYAGSIEIGTAPIRCESACVVSGIRDSRLQASTCANTQLNDCGIVDASRRMREKKRARDVAWHVSSSEGLTSLPTTLAG